MGERVLHTKKLVIHNAEGHPAYLVGISEDITERKNSENSLRKSKESAERAYKELEIFSYSVAHDLRAPLRKIDGYAQALLEEYSASIDDAGKDFLRRQCAACQHMANLIDGLLNLARVVRKGISPEKVDLSAIADTIAASLRDNEPERSVEIIIQPNLTVNGDAQLLRDAMENLIANAWKFTTKRRDARIEIGMSQQAGANAYFIRDNGVGFDMSYVGKLFIPFERLHTTTEFPGRGIGLATTQRIIQRHGGRIWAEGTLDHGAIFYFTLWN